MNARNRCVTYHRYMAQEKESLMKEVGTYMYENQGTIRSTAKHFNMSKTTIHNWMRVQLQELDLDLYYRVDEVIQHNLQERAARGGRASKRRPTKHKDDSLSQHVFENTADTITKKYAIPKS